ncbi:Lrp/AsnC family transcriptional regulator [Rossellomorea marisflavi]|uniref:Lrp/AsnC family transcriptional regulator n=1 Tax=Rossellomorea marisflavi TaxID=189381 RepID=UPI0034590BCA
MDEINRQIMEELQQDGRLSMTELGRRVSLSVPAVKERVMRLEEQGVITGYHAKVDPDRVGKTVKAFILMKTHRCKAFRSFCREHTDVMECHRLTGEYSYLVKLVTGTNAELEDFIDAAMEYGEPYTMMNLSSPVPGKPLTVGEA